MPFAILREHIAYIELRHLQQVANIVLIFLAVQAAQGATTACGNFCTVDVQDAASENSKHFRSVSLG